MMPTLQEIPADTPLDAPAKKPDPIQPTLREVPPGTRLMPAPGASLPPIDKHSVTLSAPEEFEQLPLPVQAAVSLDDTIRMFAAGASFEWADEAAALMNSTIGMHSYAQALEYERQRDKDIREREPGAALTANIAGGIASGLALTVLGGGALAVQAGGKAVQYGVGALAGAGAGALTGAGAAEEGKRGEGALVGGAIGAVAGVGAVLTKDIVMGVIRRVLTSKPERKLQKAAEKIMQALERDEMTPDEAMAKLKELGPDAQLVDVGGENMQGLARTVSSTPGKGKQIAQEFLETRQAGQGARLVETVNEFLDPAGDYAKAADDLNAVRKATAKPFYDAAYAKEIAPSEELISLFRRPALKQAWARAQKIAANEGDTLPDELFIKRPDGGEIVNPDAIKNVKVLDYIKRGLDDIVERAKDDITGQIKGEVARGVNALRKQFIKLIDDLSPDYKAARDAWSGPSRALDMMKQGRRFARADEEVTVKALKAMTEDERFFFRMGAARELRDMIYKTRDGADAVKRIFGNQLQRQRLRTLFPDDESFDEFSKIMDREATFYETRRVGPRSGSQTQPRQAETEELMTSGAWLAAGNKGPALVGIIRRLTGKAELTPEQAELIAQALFQNSPETNRKILDALIFSRWIQTGGNLTGAVGAVEAGHESGAVTQR